MSLTKSTGGGFPRPGGGSLHEGGPQRAVFALAVVSLSPRRPRVAKTTSVPDPALLRLYGLHSVARRRATGRRPLHLRGRPTGLLRHASSRTGAIGSRRQRRSRSVSSVICLSSASRSLASRCIDGTEVSRGPAGLSNAVPQNRRRPSLRPPDPEIFCNALNLWHGRIETRVTSKPWARSASPMLLASRV